MKQLFCTILLILFSLLSVQAKSQSKEDGKAKSPVATMATYDIDLSSFPEVQRLLEQNKIVEAIQLLDAKVQLFENDPNYFNLLGVLHLRQKSYVSAAAAFERVVLIQSDNAGAWLDLAIASFEAGEGVISAQYFDYIESALSPNSRVLALIQNYRARIAQHAKKRAPWKTQMEFGLGYDTNANSGLLESHINISFQGQVIEVPLDLLDRKRADSYKNIVLSSRYQGQKLGGDIFLATTLSNKYFVKEHAFSFNDFVASVGYVRRTAYLDVGAGASAEHFFLGGAPLLRNAGISTFIEKTFANCHVNLVLEAERRRYLRSQSESLNGNLLWQNLGLTCQSKQDFGTLQTSAILRNGIDQPEGFRAGGKVNKHEANAKIAWSARQNWRTELGLSYSRAQDAEGYSVLLENNAIRTVIRKSLRLQLNYQVSSRYSLFLNLEKSLNASNLSIFRQSSNNLVFGLQTSH